MKIGIVGAPGSGKTELAKALQDKLDGKTHIIDDYVGDIGVECDLAMGAGATYIGNLYVLLGRYARERKAWGCGCWDNTITCGTMVETSVYATLNAMAMQPPGNEATNWTRISNFMNVTGSFFQDTMVPPEGYDHIFILSLENADRQTTGGQIDQHLFMALNSFGLLYTPLSGTLDEKIEKALEQINGEDQVGAEEVSVTAVE